MRNKIIELAQADLGYKEGTNNDTKYGTWYGLPNQPYCAMAICYWANKAGIAQDIIMPFASCTTGYNWFKSIKRTANRGYIPQKGDICFIVWTNGEATADHVGIVESCDGKIVNTIEANRSDTVKRCSYDINSWQIYGYGLPNYIENVEPKPQPTKPYPNILFSTRYNSRHAEVRNIQCKLKEKGYNLNKYGADGIFGNETYLAVKKFQEDNKIANSINSRGQGDCIVGKNTWDKLFN